MSYYAKRIGKIIDDNIAGVRTRYAFVELIGMPNRYFVYRVESLGEHARYSIYELPNVLDSDDPDFSFEKVVDTVNVYGLEWSKTNEWLAGLITSEDGENVKVRMPCKRGRYRARTIDRNSIRYARQIAITARRRLLATIEEHEVELRELQQAEDGADVNQAWATAHVHTCLVGLNNELAKIERQIISLVDQLRYQYYLYLAKNNRDPSTPILFWERNKDGKLVNPAPVEPELSV